jgi:predicted amidophosphoribosyltransferase
VGWIGCLSFATIASLGKLFLPKLSCPRCHWRVGNSVDRFCPDCGAEAIEKGKFLRQPLCRSCGRQLTTSRRGRRLYQIHCCTQCGALLDHEGL